MLAKWVSNETDSLWPLVLGVCTTKRRGNAPSADSVWVAALSPGVIARTAVLEFQCPTDGEESYGLLAAFVSCCLDPSGALGRPRSSEMLFNLCGAAGSLPPLQLCWWLIEALFMQSWEQDKSSCSPVVLLIEV